MVVIIRTFIKDYKNFLEYIVSWMTGTMDIIFEFPCTMTMTLDSTTIIIFIGHVIKFLFVYVTDFLFFLYFLSCFFVKGNISFFSKFIISVACFRKYSKISVCELPNNIYFTKACKTERKLFNSKWKTFAKNQIINTCHIKDHL